MEKLALTVDQLAQLVCLPRSKQLNWLKKLATGEYKLEWHAETHEWALVELVD